MNKIETKQFQKLLEKFESNTTYDKVLEAEKNNKITFNNYDIDAIEYVTLTERVTANFSRELESDSLFIPLYFPYSISKKDRSTNEDVISTSHLSIKDTYNNIIEVAISKVYNANGQEKPQIIDTPIQALIALIHFQKSFGIWDKSDADYEIEELHSENERLKKYLDQTQTMKIHVQGLIERSEKILHKAEKFYKDQIEEEETVKERWKKTEEFANYADESQRKIDKLSYQSEASFKTIESLIEDIESTKKDLNQSVTQAHVTKNEYTKVAGKLVSTIKTLESNNEEVKRLLNLIVEDKLHEKFSQRVIDINKTLDQWRIAIYITGIVALVFIYMVFYQLTENVVSVDPLLLISTTLKTIPAIYILYYCISQYNKERNIKEEYAFKASVAYSLSHYAELLKDDSSKSKMLLESINKIHNAPYVSRDTKDNVSVLDTAKDVITKVADIQKTATNMVTNNGQTTEDKKEDKGSKANT
ncbi:hypothetical protein [Flammeovirga sp. OC4]|uniref:hypothetical protein n=1 Tax=Flammeovirga sp. OC4 TaxID=1382345 RepID=UPI0005C6E7EB|nr:hypothetical protein [Flammeovirga sp. OC4]